ncbi:nucleotidyltransferase domain-containing protein [Subtercola boreus]|nr:nucleotidyltransferase domain-containing protein [Subtercola boreus]
MTSLVRSLEGRIFTTLARTTDGLTGSRVAHLIEHASNPGIQTALKRMVLEGTVLSRRVGSASVYELNREHLLWPAIETLVEATNEVVHSLEARIVTEVQAVLGTREARIVTLAFFGSVARGTSTANSDIDLVAYFPLTVDDEAAERVVSALTSKVPRWTGNECNIYALSGADAVALKSADDPLLLSWHQDSRTFNGPDLRTILGAATVSDSR